MFICVYKKRKENPGNHFATILYLEDYTMGRNPAYYINKLPVEWSVSKLLKTDKIRDEARENELHCPVS